MSARERNWRSPRTLAVAVCLTALTASAGAQAVENTSFVSADGVRTLQHQVILSATPAQVFDAFTTVDGLRAWAVPFAAVDFKVGGIWESSYSLSGRAGDAGNIKNRYLAYVPGRMVAFQAVAAPPTFQHPEVLTDVFTVAEIEGVSEGKTRLTLSMVGYRSGREFDAVYELFLRNNAWSLEQLQKRFVSGPVDWKALIGEHGAKR